MLLQYFDLEKETFLSTDSHITGLGAMLTQGETNQDAKPVALLLRLSTELNLNIPNGI